MGKTCLGIDYLFHRKLADKMLKITKSVKLYECTNLYVIEFFWALTHNGSRVVI